MLQWMGKTYASKNIQATLIVFAGCSVCVCMYVYISVCTCVFYLHVYLHRLHDLVLELETAVSHHEGAGNQIQLFCQNN